eukprot:1127443-Prorocentrum_minimum.AAC.1
MLPASDWSVMKTSDSARSGRACAGPRGDLAAAPGHRGQPLGGHARAGGGGGGGGGRGPAGAGRPRLGRRQGRHP